MKKRKTKSAISSKYLLLIMTGVCVVTMLIGFTFNISGGPLHAVAGYVFIAMQKGINQIGGFIYG